MGIIGLQIVAIFFALAMIYFAILNYKRRELSGIEILSWLVVWAFVIFVAAFPEFLRTFAKAFFLSRVFDLMVVGGFIVVLSIASISYMRTKRMEKKFEELVRKTALKEFGKKDKK